jgi:hypothetical protein
MAKFKQIIVHSHGGAPPPFTSMKLGALDATGLANANLEITAASLFIRRRINGHTCTGTPILLSDPPTTGYTGDVLSAGGWINPDGYPGASVVQSVLEVPEPERQRSSGNSLTGAVAYP